MAPTKRLSLPRDAPGSSRPPKKAKSISCFSENTTGHSMLELETIIWKQNRKIEELEMMTVQKIEELQTEVNELKEKLNVLENPTATNQTKSEQVDHGQYELRIEGTIKKRLYTGSKVEGKNGELLKVAIYCNGEKITSGPLASAKFEILVIKGDFCAINQGSWNPEIFQRSLVKARGDVGSILKGSYMSQFANGEAVLGGLIFKDNSGWVDGKKWRLGIRLLDTNGVRVLEAISDCFRVLDRHGKGSDKPHPPLLTDGVDKLEKVGKKRASDLQEKEICTIKDFLQFFHMNPSELLQILGIKSESDESWKAMIGHAKECDVEPYLYSYRKNNIMIFFNSVYEVVGAEFGNHYRSFDKLLDHEKIWVNEWKKGFFENITNGDFRADFEMVNGQPAPVIEHDFTGILTDDDDDDDDALLYDQTEGPQDTQPSGITLFSDASPSRFKKDSVPDIRRDTNQYIRSDHNTAPNNPSIQDEITSQVQEQEGSFISTLEFNSTSVDGNLVGSAESYHVINSQRENLDSQYAFQQMLTYSQSPFLNEAYITEVLNMLNDEQPVNIPSEWNSDSARTTLKVVHFAARLLQYLRRDHLTN